MSIYYIKWKSKASMMTNEKKKSILFLKRKKLIQLPADLTVHNIFVKTNGSLLTKLFYYYFNLFRNFKAGVALIKGHIESKANRFYYFNSTPFSCLIKASKPKISFS